MDIGSHVRVLENNAVVLGDFVARMSDAEMRRRIRDYWTIREHLEHLVVSQTILLERIRVFIAEEHPEIRPYQPDMSVESGLGSLDADGLVERFASIRKEQIRLIRDAGPEVWTRQARHPEYRKYDFDILVRHILVHDGLHLWRMEELWIGKEEYLKPLETI